MTGTDSQGGYLNVFREYGRSTQRGESALICENLRSMRAEPDFPAACRRMENKGNGQANSCFSKTQSNMGYFSLF